MASNGVHEREEWFGCACCPGNVTRFMASIPGYGYACSEGKVYVNLYTEGNAHINLQESEIELIQKTDYPWEGDVEITVNPSETKSFSLMLRIPGWSQNKPVPTDLYTYVDNANGEVTIAVNGKPIKKTLKEGYAVINREWKAGDKVTIRMDMPVRRVRTHPEAAYNNGLLSMERGPVLYALESIDQPDSYLFDIVIPRDAAIEDHFEKELLNGVTVLSGEAFKVIKTESGELTEKPFTFKAIPYSTWNNRGKGQLVVFTPETAEHAIVKPTPTLASKAKMVNGWGFNDQFEPKSSADINTPYHYWWLRWGTEETIGYTFDKPETVSSVEVYWLAFDHYDVIYKAPESWKLMYKEGNVWKEVRNPSPYGTKTDQYNKVTFDPVTTTELKIVAQLQRPKTSNTSEDKGPQVVDVTRRGYSGGVIEWRVN